MNVKTDNFANHPKELLNDRKRSFTCNQCNYTGDRPGNLKKKKHVLVHNGSCTCCDNSSSASSSLKSHTMIHSRKPFSSKQCNYSFTRSSHFKTHMLIHSGEKLYSCSHCYAMHCSPPAQQLVIPKITSVPIQEKNRFIVINATIQAPWHIWNDTNSSTPEKSSSAAHNVASHVQEMLISKITSRFTQEKSRSNAIYATIQALELLMWKNTSALTLERSPSNAISAIILALKLVLWIYTCANTLEKSRSSVVNVISLVKASAIFGSTWWKLHTLHLQKYNKANRVKAPPRGFEAYKKYSSVFCSFQDRQPKSNFYWNWVRVSTKKYF